MRTKPVTTMIITTAIIIWYYKHSEQIWQDPYGLKQMLVLEKSQNRNTSKRYSGRLGHSVVSLCFKHLVVYLRHCPHVWNMRPGVITCPCTFVKFCDKYMKLHFTTFTPMFQTSGRTFQVCCCISCKYYVM